MPSRFSVKMRTRRSFHFGRRARWPLPNGGRPGHRFVADPVDEPPDLGVGQVPRLPRRSPASGRGAPARGARAPRPSASRGDSASAAAVTASICGRLLGLELLRRPLAALVVGVGRRGEAGSASSLGCAVAAARCRAFSHCRSHRRPVDLEAARERLDRGEQALLQARRRAGRRRPARGAWCSRSAPRARCGTRRAGARARARARPSGRPSMSTLDDVALREAALDLADVLLEPADHHVLERLLAPHLDAAA